MKISGCPTDPIFKRPTKQNLHIYPVFIVPQHLIIQFLTDKYILASILFYPSWGGGGSKMFDPRSWLLAAPTP